MSSTIVTPTDERFRFCGVHVKVGVCCKRSVTNTSSFPILSVVIAVIGIVYSIVMTVITIATEEELDRLAWITLVVGFLLAFSAHALILVALWLKKPQLFGMYFFVQVCLVLCPEGA